MRMRLLLSLVSDFAAGPARGSPDRPFLLRTLTNSTPRIATAPPTREIRVGTSPSQTKAMRIAAGGIRDSMVTALDAGSLKKA